MVSRNIWKNYFDVVILPPPAVRDYAIELSSRLKKYGRFVLGKRRYIPHISLYHIPVRPETFDAFRDEVENIAATFDGAELKLQKIELPLLMTEKPPWLVQLHREVVKRTNRYFDWDYGAGELWNTDRLPANLRVRAKGYLQKYGSPMIGAAFRPHITLTSFEDKSVVDEIPPLAFKPLSFHVESIQICELGPHHSCQRIITRSARRRLA